VLTQTWPGPPPAAAEVGIGVAAVLAGGVAGAIAGAGAFAAAVGVAAAGAIAGAVDFAAGAAAGVVEALAGAAAPFHSFTPPCPEQAPDLDAAVVYVPSLHSPVEPAGAWALLLSEMINPAVMIDAATMSFIAFTPNVGRLSLRQSRIEAAVTHAGLSFSTIGPQIFSGGKQSKWASWTSRTLRAKPASPDIIAKTIAAIPLKPFEFLRV